MTFKWLSWRRTNNKFADVINACVTSTFVSMETYDDEIIRWRHSSYPWKRRPTPRAKNKLADVISAVRVPCQRGRSWWGLRWRRSTSCGRFSCPSFDDSGTRSSLGVRSAGASATVPIVLASLCTCWWRRRAPTRPAVALCTVGAFSGPGSADLGPHPSSCGSRAAWVGETQRVNGRVWQPGRNIG